MLKLYNDKILTPELKAVLKYKMENDMMFFARFLFRETLNKKLIQFEHLFVIKDELMQMYDYKTKMLIINIPPRFGKTMMLVIFISWCLAKNPKARFLYITGGADLAAQTSKEIREIVDSNMFKEFWDVRLKQDSKAVGNWQTEEGGGVKCATIKGVITGFGAGVIKENIEHYESGETIYDGGVFLDDLNKILDTLSSNKNNSIVNDLIFNTILSRINSPWTNFCLIQQRAGDNDATASISEYFSESELIDSGVIDQRFKHLVMPVINEETKKPLCPQIQSLGNIEKLRTNYKTAHTFDTQYMQRPVNANSYFFPKHELKYFTLDQFNDNSDSIKLSCIDGADGGTDHYAALHGKFVNGLFYVMDVDFKQGNRISESIEDSIAKIKINHSHNVKLEINKEGTLLVDKFQEDLQGVQIDDYYHSIKKIIRITIQQKFILDNFRFRSDIKEGSEYYLFMKALTTFTKKSDHDDAPDATASMAHYIRDEFLFEESEPITKASLGF